MKLSALVKIFFVAHRIGVTTMYNTQICFLRLQIVLTCWIFCWKESYFKNDALPYWTSNFFENHIKIKQNLLKNISIKNNLFKAKNSHIQLLVVQIGCQRLHRWCRKNGPCCRSSLSECDWNVMNMYYIISVLEQKYINHPIQRETL